MPHIIITPPGMNARSYLLNPNHEIIQIGRGSSNGIVIDCPSISTVHAELVRVEGGYELRDLDSTNGIKKDGHPHKKILLKDGDRLTLGETQFEYSTGNMNSPAPMADASVAEAKPEAATATGPTRLPADDAPGKKPGWIGPVLFSVTGIIAVLFAVLGIEQGTGEVNEWYLFLGRFHPLAVHLPIGLLLIAALFEWLGGMRSLAHLRQAVPALLVCACLGALFAVYHGVLLAAGSGVLSETVENHLWSGVALTIAMFLLLPMRAMIARLPRLLAASCYQCLLVLSLLLLMGASHLGGNITHGKDYLVEHMPEPMRDSLSGLPKPVREFIGLVDAPPPVSASELTLYDAVFAGPIGQYCIACHKPDRVRGGLLMHTLDAILEGGDSGPSIVYGDLAASELYTRITLPEDDDFHMPPDGRKGFSETQIEWFRWWINSGIPGDTPAASINDAPSDILAAIQDVIASGGVEGGDDDAEPSESAPSWKPEDLAAVNSALASGSVIPISRNPEDGLLVVTAGAGDAFTDTDLAAIAPLAPFIVEADLSRTGITDGGMATVATWPALRRLRVDHTVIGDSGVRALNGLAELALLNLFGTQITATSVETLLAMPALTTLFVGETSLDQAALARLAELIPEIQPLPAE